MPDQLNRSPCAPRILQESARPADKPSAPLREQRSPERAHVALREETRAGKTVTLVDVTVATAGKVNRNFRLYTREVWQAAIDAAQDDLGGGKLWALLEHPEDGWDTWDPLKGRLERVCVRYETLAMDGDLVKATGVLIETSTGQDLRALLEGGIAVGVSSNGTGSVKYLKAGEVLPDYPQPEQYIEVIQDDFRLLTIDMVSDPSDVSGQARQKEQRRPKEHTMKWNEKVKKAAERLGMTVEAFVEAHAEWAQELQQESAPPVPVTTEAGSVSLTDYRALEQTVVELRGTVGNLTTENFNAARDAIAITALEAARLPSSGTVRSGETEIDLDASFRADLISAARAAESTEGAQTVVATKIAERRAVLGQREAAPARGSGHINLPTGDTSRPLTSGERATEGTRRLEGTRSRAGLI